MRDLADGLRTVAQRAGYVGVRELAEGTGISRTTISDALTGRHVPKWETLAALLRGCDVAPDRGWRTAYEAARNAVEEEKQAAREGGRPDSGPEETAPPTAPGGTGPGTFSIRPPYGELPLRVRGRDELLDLLGSRLAASASASASGSGSRSGSGPQILFGMGGCGKTTMALHLARQARDRGYRVFWLSASTPDRLVIGMREVARELGADEEAVEAAWSGRLSATDLVWGELDAAVQPWLLVVDNADEPEWLAAESGVPGDGTGWLRSSRAGMTVVTSRVGNPHVWGHEAETHRIDVLSPLDGRDVLLDLAGEAGDPVEAQVLAERLGGLPLALKLAGSYLSRAARGAGLLRHRGSRPGGRLRSFAAYTEALGEAGAGFLDEGERRPLDDAGTEQMHRRLVGRTWELSLDLLEEQRLPEARLLMRLLSCGAPSPFPVALLHSEALPAAEDVFPAERSRRTGEGGAALDPGRADRALEALIDLSLVDVVDVGPHGSDVEQNPVPCLVSHRLVLEANALRLADGPVADRLAIWRAVARILEEGAALPPEQPANWSWWRLLAPHVGAALGAAPEDDAERVLLPLLRAGLAAFAFYVFSNSDTAEEVVRVLTERSGALGPDHPTRLSVRHRALIALPSGEEKEREYEEVLAAQVERLGPEHPETLITRHDLACFRFEHGKAPEDDTVAELREVRAVRRRVLGPDDPYTLLTHGVASQLILASDRPEAHARKCEELLAEQSAELGEDHPETLITRHDLAVSRHLSGQASDAETEAELRAVLMASRRTLRPADTYNLLIHGSLANLIALRSHDGAGGNAEYRAMIEYVASQGDHRFLPLHQRHQMAHAFDAAERWAEAEVEYRSVLDDLEAADGMGVSLYWDLTHCLTDNLTHQGRRSDAVEILDTSLTWFDDSDDARSPRCSQALRLRHKRGDLIRQDGRSEEAEREIRAVIEDRLQLVDPQDSVVLSERHCLAHTLQELARHDEAQAELRQVVSSYTQVLGPGDKRTRNAAFCLARMLHLHGDKTEALGLYEQVLEGETAAFGARHQEPLMTGFRRDQCRLDLRLLTPEDARAAFERTLSALGGVLADDHAWIGTIRQALAADGGAAGSGGN
ncbi:helix-turn-helix domain-containing protein [Streptomyces sp. UH6]|uniref:helix-turn-helix domain-containing protein n=1 Tax=Streptomyces sp. UH6 TaxID=2748379 RepID=UPI0015D49D6B|nr:helix-turn-helix domain-containing protein [Streptomyces sp. UH6]NYV75444.1 tetratricopeptide repeat protein [Streptomyces sp. UH6]